MNKIADLTLDKQVQVAYFSMEMALERGMFTYSGGLGVLAGDTIRSCADLGVPIAAVTLLSKKGYFKQHLSEEGEQTEEYKEWNPKDYCNLLPNQVPILIQGREVKLQAWEYQMKGIDGDSVPVYLLDSDIEINQEDDRDLTSYLYGGDKAYRIKQEIILGIGGVRLLKSIGHDINRYHMNEGHAAFLTLELLNELKNPDSVREKCVFTTHTPVPAGHDKFPMDQVQDLLGNTVDNRMLKTLEQDGKLNMTSLGLKFSHYINGVAKKHGEISQEMFPEYPIHFITNGVHSREWTSPEFQKLFDKHIPGWRNDSYSLRSALGIPKKELWAAHVDAKISLFDYVKNETGKQLDSNAFTIGFARRSTPYKRADLLFRDMDKLREIKNKHGKIQIIYAGKAHPQDGDGKELIKKIYGAAKELNGDIDITYLPNYNLDIGKLITSGVDVWLNTPRKPKEASGTSGMKACHNGVLNLSVLDGWWLEGHVEGDTGWSIGTKHGQSDDHLDSLDLYNKLNTIVPMFYNDKDKWADMMRKSIGVNASFFNTHRMVHQYVLNAYFK